MSFLGRKFRGKFEGDVVTDEVGHALRGRLPGHRVKHRMKQHWLKMDNLRGFTNHDLREKLAATSFRLREDQKKRSAQVSRLLHRLHVYRLVAQIPRSRRWRVTAFGHRVISASLRLRQLHFPTLYAGAP